jgi:hypothetical protein
MDVDTFCKIYQRKMWKSMISRKKLTINIWDLIESQNEKVYYMPYSGIYKILVNTRYCLKCSTELDIGFRKNEFIVKTCSCSADNKNYATLDKLTTTFPLDKALKVLDDFNTQKTRKFPNKLKYWIDQGYTVEEAEEKVKEVQVNRSNKSPASKKGAQGFSIRTLEYWIKKGYTKEESYQKISEYQVKNGLEWYTSRYGVKEGKEKYYKRISKWLESYKVALDNDPTINERKMISFCNASKESLEIFMPLYTEFKDKVKIYLGIEGNHEYFLRNDKSIVFYDFTIPEINVIIEYNGSKFHPNQTLLTEEELKYWTSLFSNESAETVLAKDLAKRKIAENNGYTVITVWDTDNKYETVKNLRQVIQERLDGI